MLVVEFNGRHYVGELIRRLTLATDRSLFGMFKGFMDEAGLNPQNIACAVAGFVGSEGACDGTAEKWSEMVKPIGYFHAKDFFKRPEGKMSGIYEGIHATDADACAFKLIDLLKKSPLVPLRLVINAHIFKTLSLDEQKWMTSAAIYGRDWPSQGSTNPYFACFHYCVTEANQFTPENEKMYLTFDRQETYVGNAQKIFNQLKEIGGKWGGHLGESIVFTDKQSAVLLQSADLLAHSIGQLLNKKGARNKVVQYALDNLAIGKKYVVAMVVNSLDQHLKKCPFRTTFWEGFSEPDLIEQVSAQGHKILTYKANERLYLTHHLKAGRVKTIATISPQPLAGRNLVDERDDSTK